MTILVVGYSFGEAAALFLHSFAGLVRIFLGMLLVLIVSDKVLKIQIITKPEVRAPCSKCSSKTTFVNFCQSCGRFIGRSSDLISKGLFVKLFLLLIGCSIVVLSINAPIFTTAKDSIELAPSGALQNSANVFPNIPDYTLAFLYRDVEYEKVATQDTSLVYGYFPSNISDEVVYAVVGVSSSISNLHNWEVCFVSYQTSQGRNPMVQVYDSREIQLLQDPPLIAKYFVFYSPDNYTQITLYWYTQATFKAGFTAQQKYVRISLIILTQDTNSYAQFEKQLLVVGQDIANKWEPLQSQSLISLGVPAQQALLAISVAFLSVTITTQYISEKRRISTNLKLFNNFASPKERLVFQTLLDLSKEKDVITTTDIVENVRKRRGGRSISFKKVLNALNVLDEYSLIHRKVVSVENSPLLVWKV
jgi:hypothetical protein